ncbi:MAG: ChbG/HpnK family deacetylase [Candidatus Korobacteraceae bacterium]
MRRLIVNADDFGLTTGVNRAIVEAHQHGIVTSATMMAGAEAFQNAAEQARASAQSGAHFGVGCHVMLVDGTPLVPADQIPSLASWDDGVPHFRKTLNSFALAAVMGKLKPNEIEAEAAAQIERVQQAGITVSHVDTHKHVHLFPAVLRPLLRAAKACGVSAARNPFEPAYITALGPTDWRSQKRRLQMRILSAYAAGFRSELAAQGMRTTDGSLGVLVTGVLNVDLFLQMVSQIPDGTWEFVCHPGYNDSELDRVKTRLRESRRQELEVLTSMEAKIALEKQGVRLISYREL